jgi:hypothetical protein
MTNLPGWGWLKPRLGRTSHYFEAGLSLCGRWGWLRGWWYRPHRPVHDRCCQDCLRELSEHLDEHLETGRKARELWEREG